MGLGGGGTPGTDLPLIVKGSLTSIMAGGTVSEFAPSTNPSSYGTNPNVLSFIRNYATTFAGGNAYEGVTAYDPEEELSHTQEFLSKVIARLEGVDSEQDTADRFSAGFSNALSDVQAVNVESLVDTVLTKAINLAKEQTDERFEDALQKINSVQITDIIGEAFSDMPIREFRLIEDSAFETVSSLSLQNVDTVEDLGIAALEDEVLDSSQIDATIANVVSAFRERNLTEQNRAIKELGARFSNLGSAHSSGYYIGLALTKRSFDQRADQFEADTASRILTSVLQLSQDVRLARIQEHRDVVLNKLGIAREIDIERIRGDRERNLVIARLDQETELSRTNALKDVELLRARLELDVNIARVRSFVELYVQTMQRTIASNVQAHLVESDQRFRHGVASAGQMFQAESGLLEYYQSMAALQGEVDKMKIIALQEEAGKNLEYEIQEGLWDLRIFQSGANILSSSTGAVVREPEKPSATATALGAAAIGGSIGARLGGPKGAAIGAGAGLALGIGAGIFDSLRD